MSLMGTMVGPVTQEQAILQQLQALSQTPNPNLEAANQQAAGAQQAYVGAAAQPPPQLDLAALLVPGLLNNVASVISGNPSYAENAQSDLKTRKSDLLKVREQNLQALRDTYLQKADQAQKLGDLDATEKYRAKLETLSKTHEGLLQQLRLDESARQNQLDRASNERIAQIRANNSSTSTAPGADWTDDTYDAAIEQLVSGQVQNLQAYPTRVRGEISRRMKAQGRVMMPQTVRKSLDALGAARSVVDEIAGLSAQVNTTQPLDWIGQAGKQAGALTGLDVAATGLRKARVGLAGNLARSISAERGVLTDPDLQRALSLVPDVTTPEKIARDQLDRLYKFIQAKEDMAVLAYTTEGGGLKLQRIKDAAMSAARKGEFGVVKKLVDENPWLDEGYPELETVITAMKSRKKGGK